jgi:hypothetical protein
MAAFFPENWLQVLQGIEASLADAIRAAETREVSLAPEGASAEQGVLGVSLDLEAPRRQVATMLEELDRGLANEEAIVRQREAEISDLGRRLTDWLTRVS